MNLNVISRGKGKTIIFLHGMAGSLNYWASYIESLSQTHRVIAIDLLGFGLSPQSADEYTVSAHCDAISETLEGMNIRGSITLVGHSMGALLALKYAVMYKHNVGQLVLLNMPIFVSPEEARRDITQNKKILKYMYYGRSSKLLCILWCGYLRPISRRIAPIYLSSKPKQVAQDSVMHTWDSYSESMTHIIEQQTVQKDLDKLSVPVKLIYGNTESAIIMKNVKSLRLRSNVKIIFAEGSHNLPLEKPSEIMGYINSL